MFAWEAYEQGADVNAFTQEGLTLTEIALQLGHIEAASILAGAVSRPSTNQTFVTFPTMNQSIDDMQTLIQQGANINKKNDNGQTALMLATQSGNQSCVKWLLQQRACTFTRDNNSMTALSHAVAGREVQMIRVMLKHMEESGSQKLEAAWIDAFKMCIDLSPSNASIAIAKEFLKIQSFGESNATELVESCTAAGNLIVLKILSEYLSKNDPLETGLFTVAAQVKTWIYFAVLLIT